MVLLQHISASGGPLSSTLQNAGAGLLVTAIDPRTRNPPSQAVTLAQRQIIRAIRKSNLQNVRGESPPPRQSPADFAS
jgi:hypothetical protein